MMKNSAKNNGRIFQLFANKTLRRWFLDKIMHKTIDRCYHVYSICQRIAVFEVNKGTFIYIAKLMAWPKYPLFKYIQYELVNIVKCRRHAHDIEYFKVDENKPKIRWK